MAAVRGRGRLARGPPPRLVHPRGASEAYLGGPVRRGRHSWPGTAFEVAGPLDTERFRRALQRWIDRHEPLRSHAHLAEEQSGGGLVRRTAPPGRVSVRPIRHDPADPGTIHDHLLGLFDDYTTPHLWPSYVFATLERT